MKDISIPFSLFDFFAILLPGAVGAFGLYLFANPALTPAGHQALVSQVVLGQITGQIAVLTGVVLFSYLMGHVLNALSELLVDRPANALLGWSTSQYLVGLRLSVDKGLRWTGFGWPPRLPLHRQYAWAAPEEASAFGRLLRTCVEETFGADVFDEVRYTFNLVQASVREHKKEAAATAQIFIATAVMFQSLAVAMLLIGVALLWGVISAQISAASFVGGEALVVVLLLIFLFSYRRYKRMWVDTFFVAFVTWAKETS
jgi:hypothetical protein